MNLRATAVVAIFALAMVTDTIAGGRSGGYVHGYTRKDGTYVQGYYRSPSGDYSSYSTARGTRSTSTPAYSTLSYPQPAVRSYYGSFGYVNRDADGHIKRSESAKRQFMRQTGYPNGRPGYVVDHIVPLYKGGCDCPPNMQWQTQAEAKAKDKWE